MKGDGWDGTMHRQSWGVQMSQALALLPLFTQCTAFLEASHLAERAQILEMKSLPSSAGPTQSLEYNRHFKNVKRGNELHDSFHHMCVIYIHDPSTDTVFYKGSDKC